MGFRTSIFASFFHAWLMKCSPSCLIPSTVLSGTSKSTCNSRLRFLGKNAALSFSSGKKPMPSQASTRVVPTTLRCTPSDFLRQTRQPRPSLVALKNLPVLQQTLRLQKLLRTSRTCSEPAELARSLSEAQTQNAQATQLARAATIFLPNWSRKPSKFLMRQLQLQ